MKKLFAALGICSLLIIAPCGCKPHSEEVGPPPFSQNFTGIAGAFGPEHDLTAVLYFIGSEANVGGIALRGTEASAEPFTFTYQISEQGKITFSFDGDGKAEGTLHGISLSVQAKAGGKDYSFSGDFYPFSILVDSETTEEGYLTAGHPFSDVVTNVEEAEGISYNGVPISYSDLIQKVMPKEAVTIIFHIDTVDYN